MAQTLEQYLLARVAEECSELAKAAMKAQSFGMESFSPKDKASAADVIDAEYIDVETVYGMLNDHRGSLVGPVAIPTEKHLRKRVKVIFFLRKAVHAGTVALTAAEETWVENIAESNVNYYADIAEEHAKIQCVARGVKHD